MVEFLGDKANSSQILMVGHFLKKRGFSKTDSCQQMGTAGQLLELELLQEPGAEGRRPTEPTLGAAASLAPGRFLSIPVAALWPLWLWDVPPCSHGAKALALWAVQVVFHLPSAPCCCHLAPSQPGHFFLTPFCLPQAPQLWLLLPSPNHPLLQGALESSLCSSWNNASTGASAAFYPLCCLLPIPRDPVGNASGFAAPPVFSFTPCYFTFLNWAVLGHSLGSLREPEQEQEPWDGRAGGDGCHCATTCLCQPSLVLHSHGAEDGQVCV